MREETLETVAAELLAIVEQQVPELAYPKNCDLPNNTITSLYLGWSLGWGMSANITVNFGRPKDGYYASSKVTVSWGTTIYLPTDARAAALLHTQVADLACRFEAMLANLRIKE